MKGYNQIDTKTQHHSSFQNISENERNKFSLSRLSDESLRSKALNILRTNRNAERLYQRNIKAIYLRKEGHPL
jgi:predicted Rossmann fold nucleotide-binding protein DprA/Smf involved in DNA uptake